MDISGNLGKYKIVETDDGDITLFSEYFDENCHSTAGAYKETLYNYVDGCKIPERLLYTDLTVLEVGFGTGIGIKATIESLNNKLENKLHFISTELDEELILWAQKNIKIDSDLFNFANLSKEEKLNLTYYSFESKNLKITILIGDARESVPKAYSKKIFKSVQAIYQDPFSPKKNPILWTIEWFKDLYNLSSKEVILSTYSASASIRKAMIEAGFVVENRKGLPPKKSCTRAYLKGENSTDILNKIKSDKIIPLRDQDVSK